MLYNIEFYQNILTSSVLNSITLSEIFNMFKITLYFADSKFKMKFFAVFAAIVAVAVAIPLGTPWTLQQLSETLSNPHVNPAIVPYLEDALNTLMEALHHGHDFVIITSILTV